MQQNYYLANIFRVFVSNIVDIMLYIEYWIVCISVCYADLLNLRVYLMIKKEKQTHNKRGLHVYILCVFHACDFHAKTRPIFCLLLGVSSNYARPITCLFTEVTCPVICWAQSELTPNKRQKMGQVQFSCGAHVCITYCTLRGQQIHVYASSLKLAIYFKSMAWWTKLSRLTLWSFTTDPSS